MSTPFNEHWLEMGACVPVDVETTAALVAEIHRLIDVIGGMALAQALRGFAAWIDDDGNLHREKPHQSYGPEPRPLVFCDTSPPAQRTWVGLTDEDVYEIGFDLAIGGIQTMKAYKAIEAKLKEKNSIKEQP